MAAPRPDAPSPWDGMYFNHASLRRDFRDVALALAAIDPQQAWACSNLQTYLELHLEALHGHHAIEDSHFFPFMAKHMMLPKKLTEDHESIIEHVRQLAGFTRALSLAPNARAPPSRACARRGPRTRPKSRRTWTTRRASCCR